MHRKESNVQKEKQEFELCKKELELFLKQVRQLLESNPGATGSVAGDVTSKLELETKPQMTQSVRVGTGHNLGEIPTDLKQ